MKCQSVNWEKHINIYHQFSATELAQTVVNVIVFGESLLHSVLDAYKLYF